MHYLFDTTSILIVDRPPNTKGAPDSTAIAGADLLSPTKPHALAIELLATTTPSAADNVNMGSPPAPVSAMDALAVRSSIPDELSGASPQVRGHAVELSRLKRNDTIWHSNAHRLA